MLKSPNAARPPRPCGYTCNVAISSSALMGNDANLFDTTIASRFSRSTCLAKRSMTPIKASTASRYSSISVQKTSDYFSIMPGHRRPSRGYRSWIPRIGPSNRPPCRPKRVPWLWPCPCRRRKRHPTRARCRPLSLKKNHIGIMHSSRQNRKSERNSMGGSVLSCIKN